MFNKLARRGRAASMLQVGWGRKQSSGSYGTAAGVALTAFLVCQGDRRPAECCGIIGYVGPQDAQSICSEAVQILQNRGYDSAGLTTINKNSQLVTTKFSSQHNTSDSISMLVSAAAKNNSGCHIGVAHTRWATHGGKTDVNAHPHHDWKNRISLVHNGTIENFEELKNELIKKGITFVSQTDTEVISNLVGLNLDSGMEFLEAVQVAVSRLRGTWGLVVVHKDFPDRLVLARHGSPLLVAGGAGQIFVASESTALARHVPEFFTLNDGEVAMVSLNEINGLMEKRTMQPVTVQDVQVSPSPYKHWTLKEIHEQPSSLSRALNHGGRFDGNRVKLGGLDHVSKPLSQLESLYLSGCGTSLNAAMYGQLLLQNLQTLNYVTSIDASEIVPTTFNSTNVGMLILSQSGETLDCVRACEIAHEAGVRLISIVNVVGSYVARLTGCGVYLNAGREVAVASTKAFTSQVAVLALVAAWFAQTKGKSQSESNALVESIKALPNLATKCLETEAACKRIARKIKNAKSLFVLGKGYGHPVALEGALKIKEIAYIHAEGFAGSALKHGPFAMLDENEKTPVILIILSDEHAPLMLNAAQQVKARGAHLIAITDDPALVSSTADDVIQIPKNGPLTALLSTIPLQLIAYHLAVARGIDPDKPRGLAKTVTVF